MADLGDTFDPNSVPEDERSFDPVPPGDYLCQVVESDVVKTKHGDGEVLKLTIDIIDGPYADRKVFENLNIRNPSAEAQRIAQRALADLCLATGVHGLRNSEELHFKPFVARLKVEPAKDGFDAKNKVSRYKPRPGAAPAAQTQARPTSEPSAAARPTSTAQPSEAARPSAPAASPSRRPWDRQSATA